MGLFLNGSGGGGGGLAVADIQDSTYTYAADAEASDTYAITLSPAPSAYAAGQLFHFKANTVNTGAATLNVNSLGAKTIKKHHDQDLADGDIEATGIVTVIYDGTNFQMTSQLGNAPAAGAATTSNLLFGGDVTNDSSARYMTAPHSYNTSNASLGAADTISYVPMYVPAATYTRIGVNVTTSAASTTIRIGIYEVDTSTGGPGALVLDAGTVDSSSTGEKEITISQALDAVPYYIALVADGGPSLTTTDNTLMDAELGLPTITSARTSHVNKTSATGEHSSLSDPALSSLTAKTNTAFRAWLRVV